LNKYLFIINPVAGKGRGRKALKRLNEVIRSNKAECTIIPTSRPGHATEIARGHREIYQVIVAVGGDGTINEVINGIDFKKNILGIIPIGSGNDLSVNLGLKQDFNKNLELIFSPKKVIKSMDIGHLKYYSHGSSRSDERYFINSLGIGFDALVAYINQTNKLFSGFFSYIIAVIKALSTYKAVELRSHFNDKPFSGKKLMVTIGNGKTTGGGFKITPDADVFDNFLDVSIIEYMKVSKIIGFFPRAMKGTLDSLPSVSTLRFSKAEIELLTPYYVHTDGELLSPAVNRLTVCVLPGILKVITNL